MLHRLKKSSKIMTGLLKSEMAKKTSNPIKLKRLQVCKFNCNEKIREIRKKSNKVLKK